MQLTFENKTIDQLSIELLQAYEPKEGYYLGFSGGKDSVVIYDLAKRSGVQFHAYYQVSPIDPPEVHKFLKEYYPEIVWDYQAKNFWNKHFMSNGLPTRDARWCCRLIKESGGNGKVKILGMRADESSTRATYKCFSEERNRLLPILKWSDSDVWQYISENHLPVNPLYREGFRRIGCVLCPYHTGKQVKFELKRFPKIVDCWKRACDRYVEVRKERGTPLTQETGKEYFDWWIQRK